MRDKINKRNLLLLLLISSLLAGVLTLINLPQWLFYFRPDWLALIVIFWIMVLPERLSLGYACINGIFLDVLTVKPFGLNALGFVLLGYFVSMWSTQMRVLSLWQQGLFVTILILLMKLVVGVVATFSSDFVFSSYYFLSAVGNMLFWFVISVLYRDIHLILQPSEMK
jgi:rod shape-determining protein MreD